MRRTFLPTTEPKIKDACLVHLKIIGGSEGAQWPERAWGVEGYTGIITFCIPGRRDLYALDVLYPFGDIRW